MRQRDEDLLAWWNALPDRTRALLFATLGLNQPATPAAADRFDQLAATLAQLRRDSPQRAQ